MTKNNIQKLNFKDSTEIVGNVSTNYQYFTPYITSIWHTENCPYCDTNLEGTEFIVEGGEYTDDMIYKDRKCPSCGWWRKNECPAKYFCGYSHIGILHKIKIDNYEDLKLGLDEIAKDKCYFRTVSPTKFEMFIKDVLGAFYDCEVIHTGKSHDGGIDMVLLDSNHGFIPVQVKRRESDSAVESVRLIREFRGAMLMAGAEKGIIVSTAHHFSSESREASLPRRKHLAPQTIDLINCKRLLDILGVIDASKSQ